jgi:hypothetical protein
VTSLDNASRWTEIRDKRQLRPSGDDILRLYFSQWEPRASG